MPPKTISLADAMPSLKAGEPKPTGATKEKILRGMFTRFEYVCAYLKANGHGGAIILPLPPRLTNGSIPGLHWTTQKELKEAYWSHCDALLYQRLIPKAIGKPPDFVRCEVQIYVSRLGDSDNNSARRKWCCDWLTKNKYIADDSPAHFGLVEKAPALAPRKACRIEFRILENE